MTVKQLRTLLEHLDDNTEIELYISTGMGDYIAPADELVIGTDTNRACLCGEE